MSESKLYVLYHRYYWVLMSWTSVILDGEMMVWDPVVERYLAFGTLKSAALGELSVWKP